MKLIHQFEESSLWVRIWSCVGPNRSSQAVWRIIHEADGFFVRRNLEESSVMPTYTLITIAILPYECQWLGQKFLPIKISACHGVLVYACKRTIMMSIANVRWWVRNGDQHKLRELTMINVNEHLRSHICCTAGGSLAGSVQLGERYIPLRRREQVVGDQCLRACFDWIIVC